MGIVQNDVIYDIGIKKLTGFSTLCGRSPITPKYIKVNDESTTYDNK